MAFKGIFRAVGRGLLFIATPWAGIKSLLNQSRNTREAHAGNLIYIRDLYRHARSKLDSGKASNKGVDDMPFELVFARHPNPEQLLTGLKRRYLFQKRLALACGAAITIISLCAIANGQWLAIATILSSMPLLFMACLSATFRLWQLRDRRLSRQEQGGLGDFFRCNAGWFWLVLNPERQTRLGE